MLKDTPCYEDAFYNLCLHYLNSSHPVEVFFKVGISENISSDSAHRWLFAGKRYCIVLNKVCFWETIIAKSVKKMTCFLLNCEQNGTVEQELCWCTVKQSGHAQGSAWAQNSEIDFFLQAPDWVSAKWMLILMATFSRTSSKTKPKPGFPEC